MTVFTDGFFTISLAQRREKFQERFDGPYAARAGTGIAMPVACIYKL
jgi:hypothetical protein